MRRKDREIVDRQDLDAIISRAQTLFLAMADHNVPYVIPLSFGYDGTHFYFHTANQGLKLDFLRKNPAVCFALTGHVYYESVMTSCDAGTQFESVVGRGTCAIVTDPAEKALGLDILLAHYTASRIEYPPAALAATTIVKITITEIKGKRRH